MWLMLKFEKDFSLSNITTLRIGGAAKLYIIAHTQEELFEAVRYAKENKFPFLVIGGGSNLLISDQGVNYLFIRNETEGIVKEGRSLKVKSGTKLQNLVDYSIAQSLSGLQKITGIPGTVGGAVYGNAGAYGQTISDFIREVKCLDQSGEIITLDKYECEFGYRDSIFKKNKLIVLEVFFKLDPGKSKDLEKQSEEILEKRLLKYPKGIKCPGSFFKNIVANTLPKDILDKIPPEKIVYGKLPAGSLLEEVGAKGDSLGNIEIADYHANLFINKGGGKASDFYALAKKYAAKVYEKYGIKLEPEVQLINLPPLLI